MYTGARRSICHICNNCVRVKPTAAYQLPTNPHSVLVCVVVASAAPPILFTTPRHARTLTPVDPRFVRHSCAATDSHSPSSAHTQPPYSTHHTHTALRIRRHQRPCCCCEPAWRRLRAPRARRALARGAGWPHTQNACCTRPRRCPCKRACVCWGGGGGGGSSSSGLQLSSTSRAGSCTVTRSAARCAPVRRR
jgi:hypothetical protein